MTNPWLDIPEADYVGHMSSPAVDQRPALNRLLADVLHRARPASVLIAGCSTGNGLEHVNPQVTRRVSAVDVNPRYLRRLAEKFPDPAFELDIRCADLNDAAFDAGAFDLIHAALVLEYVDWRPLIERLVRALTSHGILSVVLQRPSSSTPAVTPTEFSSLRLLEPLFHFVDPDELVAAADDVGLTIEHRRIDPLPGGKAFEVLRFVRSHSKHPARTSSQ
jgi:SAM-dependent methyltransferase